MKRKGCGHPLPGCMKVLVTDGLFPGHCPKIVASGVLINSLDYLDAQRSL